MPGGDVEDPLPGPASPGGGGGASDAVPPRRAQWKVALAACFLAAVVLAIVLGVALGGGGGDDVRNASANVSADAERDRADDAGAAAPTTPPATQSSDNETSAVIDVRDPPAPAPNPKIINRCGVDGAMPHEYMVTLKLQQHPDGSRLDATEDKLNFLKAWAHEYEQEENSNGIDFKALHYFTETQFAIAVKADDEVVMRMAEDVDVLSVESDCLQRAEIPVSDDAAGAAAGDGAGVVAQAYQARYLASAGPIAARVRLIDPRAADGYGSCDDLREDLGEALKHYANAVILREAEPWNDWYEECECDTDRPCQYQWGGDYGYGLAMPEAVAMESAPSASKQESTADAGAAMGQEGPEKEDSFGTNNQVEGVDESDVVKSDGEHVYAAYGDIIYAWRAADGREGASITRMPREEVDDPECTPDPPFKPFDLPPVAQLPTDPIVVQVTAEPKPKKGGEESESEGFAEASDPPKRRRASSVFWPNPCHKPKPRILSLLLSGSRLTAIVSEENFRGRWHHEAPTSDLDPILQDHARLTVRVYDVSDVPADGSPLVLLGEKEIKGNYDSARSVGGTGFVMTTSHLNTGSFANDLYRRHPQYCGLNATEYKDRAAEVAVNGTAPFVARMLAEMRLQLDGTCDGMFRLGAMQSGESDEDRSDGVLLSQFVQVLSFDMAADFADREIPTHVGGAFSSGWLSSVYASQNFAATLNVGSNFDSETGAWNQATFVLGFDISGTVPKPLCYAEIPGSPLNQYSTDLYRDHLRVVTTQNNWRSQDDRTKNKIFVLRVPEDEGKEMTKVGESAHVGKPNESVYSVRFIGPRAYIVTFERIDPFYIYDLSDPANPTKLGELEIPGFSSYLHPVEIEGVPFILGIGEHVDEESQRRAGVKISLFDISNETSPQESAMFVDEGAYSTANNDFKAFRYLSLSQKLILPKSEWSRSERENFDGFTVYDVRPGEIAPAYEIQHARSGEMYHGCWYDAYMPARSLVFQSKLTTILSHSVISTDLADGARLWNMSLDEGLNNTECSPYFFGF